MFNAIAAIAFALGLLVSPVQAAPLSPEGDPAISKCESVADFYGAVAEVNAIQKQNGREEIRLQTLDATIAKLYAKAIVDNGGPDAGYEPTSIVVLTMDNRARVVFFKNGCGDQVLDITYSIHVRLLGNVQRSL